MPAPGLPTRIVILGAGFGGVYTALHLQRLFRKDAGVYITLVDRDNYFLMTPLLFEAGMEDAYDATVAVIAPEDVRSSRAAARGHEAVDERAARQLTQEEKARRATYTVVNDGSMADLEAKLSDVLEKLSTAR